MYLSEKYSLKYLWIFEMVLELISVLSCFVLIIIQIHQSIILQKKNIKNMTINKTI